MRKTLGALGVMATIAVALAAPAAATGANTGPERWQGATVTVSADLLDAAQSWETESLRFVVSDTPEIRTIVATLDNPLAGGEASKTHNNGWITGCTITLEGEVERGILVHEIGHCIGIRHDYAKTPRSIMTRIFDKITDVTEYDRKSVEALY